MQKLCGDGGGLGDTGAMKWLVILVLAGCGTAATTSTHGDTLSSIPSAARNALERVAGGAKIEKVEREGEMYEASWHVGGLEREAAVTAQGKLVEMEEEVASTQVPPVVRAAAVARLANAQSIKFVKLMTGNYEAEAIIDGREHEITLAPDGKQIEDAEEDDDDDDDGDGAKHD